jgi:peptide/nickel transport system permease protein
MVPPPGAVDPIWLRRGDTRGRLADRISRNPSLIVGTSILGLYGAVAIAALWTWGTSIGDLSYNPVVGSIFPPLGPSPSHPFGVMMTWGVGIFTALVRATPIDLALLGGPVLLAGALGAVMGAVAAYSRGWVDALVVGVAEIQSSVPSFLLIWILYFGIVQWVPGESSLTLFGLLLAVVLWPSYAQHVRFQALEVARESYVEAARSYGSGRWRVIRRHILPNSLSPVFSQVPSDIFAIFFILTLYPFIHCYGVAASPPPLLTALPYSLYPEWGSYFANGVCLGWSLFPGNNYWWMYVFPLAVIVTFGFGIALFCDGAARFLDRVQPSSGARLFADAAPAARKRGRR